MKTKIICTILILSVTYLAYLHIPITKNVFKSKYNNAEIKVIEDNRKPFYFFSLRSIPNDSHYEIIYKGNVIAKEDRICFECLNHYILSIKWYPDSVNVLYETSYEKRDTIEVTYRFLE